MWWTQDRSGIIEIAPCAAELCGRIVGQDEPRGTDGSLPRDWRGNVQCRLEILRVHATSTPGLWKGEVLDPTNGQRWNCEIYVGPDGSLRLRGYIFTPLLGETQIWPKFSGQVSEQCDIETGPG